MRHTKYAMVFVVALDLFGMRCSGLVDFDDPLLTDSGPACPPTTAENVGKVDAGVITETSGLVVSRNNSGVLFAHNDSGDAARFYALSTDGRLLATYEYDAGVIDCEDMAADDGYLYIADIGDNAEIRDSVTVYRIAEPTVDPTQDATYETVSHSRHVYTYPDGPVNAEALLVDGALIYIINKKAETMVYRGTLDGGALEQVAVLPWAGVTAADMADDGSLFVRGYSFAYELDGFDGEACPLTLADEPQGESIAADPDGLTYWTLSEGSSQPLWRFEKVD